MSLPLLADAALVVVVIAGPLGVQYLTHRHHERRNSRRDAPRPPRGRLARMTDPEPPGEHERWVAARVAAEAAAARPVLTLAPKWEPPSLEECLRRHPASRGKRQDAP